MHRQDHTAEPLAATGLSRRPEKISKLSRVSRLARESLSWFSIMFIVTSCIVADPPQYTNPVQTQPQLNGYLASPSLLQVLPVYANAPGPTFTVPVRSEDGGEELAAVFWEDYGTASTSSRVFSSQYKPASTYDDVGRSITSTPFSVGALDTGCHTVTLLVAHISSFSSANTQTLDPEKAKTDAAIITWWVNVNPSQDQLTTLSNCPTQTPTQSATQ
jgi:hypothetical protein